MEALVIPRFGFAPVKHRKFVEQVLPASPEERAALLHYTRDARAPGGGVLPPPPPSGAAPLSPLDFDVHLFHAGLDKPRAPLA